jgi:riboflavin synthase
MFTGIVTGVGTIVRVVETARGLRLGVKSGYGRLATGESIAIDGACFTVVAKEGGKFAVEAMGATRGRTKVDGYTVGTRVNLERALTLSDRLGGHILAGHVDGVGTVTKRREAGDRSVLLDISVPPDIRELCVPHGSIAIDGVSLTINALPRRDTVQVALIPHTRDATTLGGARVGTRVHLEADLVGKFVRQLMMPHAKKEPGTRTRRTRKKGS